MKIVIKKNLDITPSLNVYIERKLAPLAKFVKKFEEEGDLELRLELARTTRHHQKGEEVFWAAADLGLPRKVIRAEEYAEDVRKAIDRVKDTLRLEIEKYKERFLEREKGK